MFPRQISSGSRLNEFSICWVPGPQIKNQMLGAEERKVFASIAKEGKNQGLCPSVPPLCREDGAAPKSLLTGERGLERKKKGDNASVDLSQSLGGWKIK